MPDEHAANDKNASLQAVKLELEIANLRQESSIPGLLRRWLQALTTLVALSGIVVAVWTTVAQQKDNQFDHALARLGGERPNERMAGVEELRSIVNGSNSRPLRERALSALIDELCVEPKPIVRDAILDALKGIDIRTLDIGLVQKHVI